MSNFDFKVRKIREDDKAEFMAMSRDFYSSDAVLYPLPDSYHENAFNEVMRSDVYADCRIFTIGENVVGYALLLKSYAREAGGVCIWTDELYIKPEYRGCGIGTRFFAWLEENLPAARYRLEAEPENEGAVRLYHRMGYKELPYMQLVKEKQ